MHSLLKILMTPTCLNLPQLSDPQISIFQYKWATEFSSRNQISHLANNFIQWNFLNRKSISSGIYTYTVSSSLLQLLDVEKFHTCIVFKMELVMIYCVRKIYRRLINIPEFKTTLRRMRGCKRWAFSHKF